MGLHSLDFLNDSPKNFIIKNKSNKTHFGGILTLVFYILTILIIIFYSIVFIAQEEFFIEYTYHEKFLMGMKKEKK